MESLNQLLACGSSENTEFCLDNTLPAIYDVSELLGIDRLSGIFARLTNEASKYSNRRCRITTSLREGVQYVYIDHDGQADAEKIARLNADLEKIAQGESWTARRSGNKMAAERLKRYNGTVHLELLDDSEYQVRTIVAIPIYDSAKR